MFATDLDGRPVSIPIDITVGSSYNARWPILKRRFNIQNGILNVEIPVPPFKYAKLYLKVCNSVKIRTELFKSRLPAVVLIVKEEIFFYSALEFSWFYPTIFSTARKSKLKLVF